MKKREAVHEKEPPSKLPRRTDESSEITSDSSIPFNKNDTLGSIPLYQERSEGINEYCISKRLMQYFVNQEAIEVKYLKSIGNFQCYSSTDPRCSTIQQSISSSEEIQQEFLSSSSTAYQQFYKNPDFFSIGEVSIEQMKSKVEVKVKNKKSAFGEISAFEQRFSYRREKLFEKEWYHPLATVISAKSSRNLSLQEKVLFQHDGKHKLGCLGHVEQCTSLIGRFFGFITQLHSIGFDDLQR